MMSDELLEPGEFPWQGTESQMTSAEIKFQLRQLVAEEAQAHLKESAKTMLEIQSIKEAQAQEKHPT